MGFYVLFDFAGDSHIIDELERNLKIDDKILKFLTVKTSEEITAAEVDEIVAAAAKAGQAAAEGAAESAEPKMIIPEGADKTAAAEASPASADTKEEGK
jgi:small subunit ribosomal protein S6